VAIRPTDFASILGLAKVDAASGRVATAIAELEQAVAIVPQPESLILLGDLRSLDGDTKGAADAYATVRAIRRLSVLEGSVYDRQLLQFELDHGGASPTILAAAEAGLAIRTDAAGYDLAAWAAYRIGHLALAQRDMDATLATGIRDARILEHAGAIAMARGDRARGGALLEEALALGPALDPFATRDAVAFFARSSTKFR
jgi:tetratricopeptide (TPR) repeat protein